MKKILNTILLLIVLIIPIGCRKKELSNEERIKKVITPEINEIISELKQKGGDTTEYVSYSILNVEENYADFFIVKGEIIMKYNDVEVKSAFKFGVTRNSVGEFVIDSSEYSLPKEFTNN